MGQITLVTKDLLDAQGALSDIGQQKKLPGKMVRQVTRLLREAGSAIDDYSAARKSVASRYDTKINDEGVEVVVPEQVTEYQKEIEELDREKVTLLGVTFIDYEQLEELAEKKKVELSGALLSGLMPFLKNFEDAEYEDEEDQDED